MTWLDWLSGAAESVGHAVSEEAHAVTHAVEQVAHDAAEFTHDALGEISSGANMIGDALDAADHAIESVPVLGTLYDFTPIHTAAHLGGEWSHVVGEAAGDVEGEMEGRHADWGHLAHQVGSAAFDTGIAIAASEIGGAASGRILGRMAGSAGRLGARTAGRDVAGSLGAGAEGTLSRRGADYLAHTAFGGAVGSVATQPALQAGHRVGGGRYGGIFNYDQSVGHERSSASGHWAGQQSASGYHNPDDQPRQVQGRGIDYVRQGVNRDGNSIGHLGGSNFPAEVVSGPQHISYKDYRSYEKAVAEGRNVPAPDSNAVIDQPTEAPGQRIIIDADGGRHIIAPGQTKP